MQIAASNLSLAAVQHRTQTIEEKSDLRMWDERAQQQSALSRREAALPRAPQCGCSAENVDDTAGIIAADPKLRSIVLALEILTGKKIRIETFRPSLQTHDVTPPQGRNSAESPRREGWGIDYSYEKTTLNTQSLDFSAEGSITLKDGTRIDLSVAFSMKSVQMSRESLSFKAGDALIDPLVVNFDAGTLELGSVRHRFDLDLDGELDEIAFASEGSGFLALDGNHDGYINDGSELFGPTLGDGFAELAAYDDDGNGWIDEADDIFSNLRIWTKDDDGVETLFTLKDKGIGAIYLENVATGFDYLNDLNEYDGKLRASSIFVGENGSVGTVQEVDLKI